MCGQGHEAPQAQAGLFALDMVIGACGAIRLVFCDSYDGVHKKLPSMMEIIEAHNV